MILKVTKEGIKLGMKSLDMVVILPRQNRYTKKVKPNKFLGVNIEIIVWFFSCVEINYFPLLICG